MEEETKKESSFASASTPPSSATSDGHGEALTDKKATEDKESKKQLEECQRQKEEYLAGWQRARADLLNYKKEEMARIGEILKYADVGLILKILPILDNFEISENKIPENLKNDENVKGLLQIKTQIHDFLKNQGLEEIKSLGEKFDPNLHEIVEEIEDKDKEPGIVIEEIQKGYRINGRLLRPARVKISK